VVGRVLGTAGSGGSGGSGARKIALSGKVVELLRVFGDEVLQTDGEAGVEGQDRDWKDWSTRCHACIRQMDLTLCF